MKTKREKIETHFARTLKKIRKGRGLTQTEICNITGIHKAHWNQLELGTISPALVTTFQIAKELDLSMDEFVPW